MLRPWVSFAIMPIFAFANAGVTLVAIAVQRRLDAGACGCGRGGLA